MRRHPVYTEKKGFASLRLCVSSLHRDHANLLCIFKRLFNVAARRLDNHQSKIIVYKQLKKGNKFNMGIGICDAWRGFEVRASIMDTGNTDVMGVDIGAACLGVTCNCSATQRQRRRIDSSPPTRSPAARLVAHVGGGAPSERRPALRP